MLERPPLSEKMPPAASKGIKKNKIDKVMTDRVQTFPCLDLLLCCSAQLPLGGRGGGAFPNRKCLLSDSPSGLPSPPPLLLLLLLAPTKKDIFIFLLGQLWRSAVQTASKKVPFGNQLPENAPSPLFPYTYGAGQITRTKWGGGQEEVVGKLPHGFFVAHQREGR